MSNIRYLICPHLTRMPHKTIRGPASGRAYTSACGYGMGVASINAGPPGLKKGGFVERCGYQEPPRIMHIGLKKKAI